MSQIAYDVLSQIIPPDQALANKALTVSLKQINNITNMTLPQLAKAANAVTTNYGLPSVNSANTAVSANVANYYTSNLGKGSGTNGVLLVTDLVGTASGYNITGPITNTVAIINTINVAYLTNVYTTMQGVINGEFSANGNITIPPGYPAAGDYSSVDDAFSTGLIPAANVEIGNLTVAYPSQTANINTNFNAAANQLVYGQTLLNKAGIQFANLQANSQQATYGLIFNLPTYGADTAQGGAAQFLQSVAQIATPGGQAVVGAMREGQNQPALSDVGIRTNTTVPALQNPPPPEANLLPSTYTAQQAAAKVII